MVPLVIYFCLFDKGPENAFQDLLRTSPRKKNKVHGMHVVEGPMESGTKHVVWMAKKWDF